MKTEQIVMFVVALLLGMLLFHMLKGVCGCKLVEAQYQHAMIAARQSISQTPFNNVREGAAEATVAPVPVPEYVKIKLPDRS
jgi:hypothetical protein